MVFFSPVAFSIAVRNSTSVVIPLFSAHAVGTSVNIIVSDNNIAKIRCFITFTSYISFYLIRFRRFKQKNRRLQDMVLPMPESAFALYSADSVKQRTPLALSWPILFFGACRSIMRIRTFGGVSAELWNQGEWRLSAVGSWLARRAP